MAESDDFLSRGLAMTTPHPLGDRIVGAEGCWLITDQGERLFDLVSGIGVSSLGHGHPDIKAALHQQVDRHLHVMVYGEYAQDAQDLAAERLLAPLRPHGLDAVYFVNSGTEAIEGARAYRDRPNGYDSGFSGESYYRVAWYHTWVRDCLRKGIPKEKLREWLSDGIGREWFHELQYNERTKDIVFRFFGWGGDKYYRVATGDIGHAKRMCRAIPYPQLKDMGFLTPMFHTNERGTIQ